jgi:hypothetical protein
MGYGGGIREGQGELRPEGKDEGRGRRKVVSQAIPSLERRVWYFAIAWFP